MTILPCQPEPTVIVYWSWIAVKLKVLQLKVFEESQEYDDQNGSIEIKIDLALVRGLNFNQSPTS